MEGGSDVVVIGAGHNGLICGNSLTGGKMIVARASPKSHPVSQAPCTTATSGAKPLAAEDPRFCPPRL